MKTTSFHLWMCTTQISKPRNSANYHSKRNWVRTFYVTPFPFLSLPSGRAPTVAQAAGCFSELLSVLNQNLIPPPDGLKNLSSSIIWAALRLHLYYTPLLRFCLNKQKWMQSQHVGNSRTESLNGVPNLEMELAGGAQSPMDSGPSTACNLLTVRDLWVLWTSLSSSAALVASHRGLSEPRPATQAELKTPWG